MELNNESEDQLSGEEFSDEIRDKTDQIVAAMSAGVESRLVRKMVDDLNISAALSRVIGSRVALKASYFAKSRQRLHRKKDTFTKDIIEVNPETEVMVGVFQGFIYYSNDEEGVLMYGVEMRYDEDDISFDSVVASVVASVEDAKIRLLGHDVSESIVDVEKEIEIVLNLLGEVDSQDFQAEVGLLRGLTERHDLDDIEFFSELSLVAIRMLATPEAADDPGIRHRVLGFARLVIDTAPFYYLEGHETVVSAVEGITSVGAEFAEKEGSIMGVALIPNYSADPDNDGLYVDQAYQLAFILLDLDGEQHMFPMQYLTAMNSRYVEDDRCHNSTRRFLARWTLAGLLDAKNDDTTSVID